MTLVGLSLAMATHCTEMQQFELSDVDHSAHKFNEMTGRARVFRYLLNITNSVAVFAGPDARRSIFLSIGGLVEANALNLSIH